jgi:hypothetical protein
MNFKVNEGFLAAVLLCSGFRVQWPVQAANAGRVGVALEHAQPVLGWSNGAGQVYAIQTSSNLAAHDWETRANLTTDAAEAVWADDSLPGQAEFYRVVLSTNPAVFQDLQRALQRACTNQGIVGASAAAIVPDYGLWLGAYRYSSNHIPVRPQTRFEVARTASNSVSSCGGAVPRPLNEDHPGRIHHILAVIEMKGHET